MRFELVTLVMSSTGVFVSAQKYNTAGGLRVGQDAGFSVVQRVLGSTTVEVTFQPGFLAPEINGQAIVRKHYPLISKRLNFFLGAGIALKIPKAPVSIEPQNSLQKGLGFQVGSEITIGRCNISFDYMPVALKSKEENRFLWSAATSVSLRYVFWKRPSQIRRLIKRHT